MNAVVKPPLKKWRHGSIFVLLYDWLNVVVVVVVGRKGMKCSGVNFQFNIILSLRKFPLLTRRAFILCGISEINQNFAFGRIKHAPYDKHCINNDDEE